MADSPRTQGMNGSEPAWCQPAWDVQSHSDDAQDHQPLGTDIAPNHQQNDHDMQDLVQNGQAATRQPDPYRDDGLTDDETVTKSDGTPLNTLDIFSLIVNKMIGTGIFSTPVTTYLLTGSKNITLILWGVGFLYSIVSMCLYLDYAAALPYTGGELVYLDEITSHTVSEIARPARGLGRFSTYLLGLGIYLSKFFGDGLFAFVVYSILFVAIFNSGTNAMAFGRMVLLANQAYAAVPFEINRDLERFIGVVTLTFLCVVQWISPKTGRRLNAWWAIIKIGFLIALIGVGGHAALGRGTFAERQQEWSQREPTVDARQNWAKALLSVLFSFEGWENATFVAGEVPLSNHKILRSGFRLSVAVVGILYLCVVAVLLDAITWDQLQDAGPSFSFPALLSGNHPQAKLGWAVVAAISSLGSLNSIIYTFSRVKQSIGSAHVLPGSRIWAKDHHIHRRSGDFDFEVSPQGGLLLHWIMTVIVIASTAAAASTLEGVSIPGLIQTYCHAFVLLILAVLFPLLPGREKSLDVNIGYGVLRFSRQTGFWRFLVLLAILSYASLNALVLIFNVINVTSYEAVDGTSAAFPGWGFPTFLGSVLIVAITYYFLMFGTAPRYYKIANGVTEPGVFKQGTWLSMLNLAHVRPELRKDTTYNQDLDRVHRFGRRWRLRYVMHRDFKHNLAPGRGQEFVGGKPVRPLNFFYWLFGGSRWISRTPWDRVDDWTQDKWEVVRSRFVPRTSPASLLNAGHRDQSDGMVTAGTI